MKKTIVTIILAGIGLTSCTEKQQILTKKDVQNRVDSVIKLKMDEINRQANEDLDYRIAIEVKAKADSIVAARKMPKDTSKPQAVAQPPQSAAERNRKFDSVMRVRHFGK